MSKKRKIILVILVVLIVFCLWYTRPRRFEELAGDGEIKSMAAAAVIFENRKGQAYTNSWTINDREGPKNVCEELGAIMKSCKYRASFWDSLLVNLKIFFSGGYSPPGEKNNRIRFHLTGMLEDGGDFAVTYYGATVIFMADSTVVAKAADQEIGDKLLAYIQKFGQES